MRKLAILLGLVVLTGAIHASGQPSRSPDPLPPLAQAVLDSAITVELADLPGAPLGLAEARAQALTGNTQVRIAAAVADAARGTVRREQGSYDPELYGEGDHRGNDQPTTSPFAGADVLKTDTTTGEAGLRWLAPLGTELSASMNAVRLETNSDLALLLPQYDAYGELRVTQPLLEGFGAGTRGALTAAERSLEAAEARFAGARLGTEAEVEIAYWALYAAGRDFTVQRIITRRAESLLEQAETRARSGAIGPADVANAKVFLAEQRQNLLDTRELLGDASDTLASLMGYRPPGNETLFRPLDTPPADFPVPAVEDLILEAEQRNHELRGLERDAAAVQARLDQAGRNALPTLDVFGALGGSGLSGSPQDVQFGGTTYTTDIDGGLGDGVSQVMKGDYPTWQVGLSFAVPLGNRAGGGERDRLSAEVVRAEQQHEAARRRLEDQVRAVHRALANGSERLDAARFGVEAASEQVRIGVLQYENGRTSAFELVRLGGDVAAAQQRYSRALVRTARAAALLRQLTGGAYPNEETSQ